MYKHNPKQVWRMPTFSESEIDSATMRFTTVTEQRHMYCLPSFFLAGFPKCGTTTLYSLITQHPQITKAASKENNFWRVLFEHPGDARLKGIQIQWYLGHFTPVVERISKNQKDLITIDASADTIWNYRTNVKTDSEICLIFAMVKRTLPEAKFIVIMRDPVERLFSDYWYMCSCSKEWKAMRDPVSKYSRTAKQSFHNITVHAIKTYNECIKEGSSRFECVRRVGLGELEGCTSLRLGAGMYYYHVVAWLNVFPRDRFLFFKMEELHTAPDVEIEKVWPFLGLRGDVHIKTDLRSDGSNKNTWIKSLKYKSSYEMLPETRELLTAFYQPHNQLLAELLADPKYLWK